MNEKNATTDGTSAATAKDTSAEVKQTIPYARCGEVAAKWFNRRLSERGNVTIELGTKKATVNRLLPDGRLEVEVPDAENTTAHTQFVDFDETMFDLLLPKLATV